MALIYPQNGDLTKSLKSARKKVPQSARLSAGGGVQKLKGQCPNAPRVNLSGASLICLFADTCLNPAQQCSLLIGHSKLSNSFPVKNSESICHLRAVLTSVAS